MNRMVALENEEYQKEFGDIPNDLKGRIEMILGSKSSNEKFNQSIALIGKRIKRMKWETVEFTMYKVLRPAARPRFSKRGAYIRAYVPRAQQNGDWFNDFFIKSDLKKIETPCYIELDVYSKTPKSFSIKKKVLSELGLIRPWKNTGDNDNFAKAAYDMIQHGLLKDDYLILDSNERKFYSIKPRVDVRIKYMKTFPEL